MSKLVSLLIVLLAIAVATPVLAEDRFTLGGELRIRGTSIVAPDYEKTSADSSQLYDQRLRLVGKIAVAEGVSIHFREDLVSGTWGTNPGQSNDTLGWMNVDLGEMLNLKAGKMTYGIGNNIAMDIKGTGAVFTLNGEIPVEFAYFRANDVFAIPISTTKDENLDIYTLAVKHGTDLYNASVFGGFWRYGAADVTKVYMGGVQSNFNLDPIKLNVELNYFTGDNGASGANKLDLRGIQAYLDAGMAVAENVTVGGMGFYARGYDDKVQIVSFANNNGSFLPDTRGSMATIYNTFASGGTAAIFDPAGEGAGVRGGQVYGTVKIMDPLTAHANIGYARPDEKVDMKSVWYANVSGTYNLATATALDGVVSYAKPSFRDSLTEDDARVVASFRLRVRF